MTLRELYELCDNLNRHTRVTVRGGYLESLLDIGNYVEMCALYGDRKITGFKIEDRMHVTIVIERGFDE